MMEENQPLNEQPSSQESWAIKLIVTDDMESELCPTMELYIRDDEDEEDEEDEREWLQEDMEDVNEVECCWPKIRISREERMRWCKPWKRALVLSFWAGIYH